MAQKRMFDKRVVDTDKFADLPHSTKALYFLAGMYADDRGFFQPKGLQRQWGFNDDDYKLLIAKGFFIIFESGVMVITDWKKNNWLDSRRITETEYIDELKLLKIVNDKYSLGKKNTLETDFAKQMLSEYRIEENRIEENRITTIFEFLEKNFGRTISPIEFEKIETWLLSFNEDIISYAIEICVMNNKKTFSYLEGILKNWKSNGYKLLQEIKDNERTKKENVPEWFDKEIKQEQLSEQELKEMEAMMSGFQEK